MKRIERLTSPLPRECSTTELHGRGEPYTIAGAGEGNRTLVVSLEGFCSTIELHPRSVATGVSSRVTDVRDSGNRSFLPQCTTSCSQLPITRSPTPDWWRGKDSNLRRQSRQIYSLLPLTAREPLRRNARF